MKISITNNDYKWHFELLDMTNWIRQEQDRSGLSFAEFIADRAESSGDVIDWSNVEISRTENESGVRFTLTPTELDEEMIRAKQILLDRENSARAGREALESRL